MRTSRLSSTGLEIPTCCAFRIPREEDETEDKVRLMDDDEKPIEVSESVA